MKVDEDDIQWLKQLLLQPQADIPPFNRSRLLTLGLIDEVDRDVRLTSRGHEVIAEHHRKNL